jgi:hypothetical protein
MVDQLADDSRACPLFTYDSRRDESNAEHLSLQGNPALREDWQPDGSVVDFVAFARTEGKFAPHLSTGEPSPGIGATQAERLANSRQLHEMAGNERGGAPAAGKEVQ